MKNNKKENNKANKNPVIDDERGLSIKYDKNELMKYFPNLMNEIYSEEHGKSINFNEINRLLEIIKNQDQKLDQSEIRELTRPGAIDFIRRCSNKLEAIEILNFLLRRQEINKMEYEKFKKKLDQGDGLKLLIEESGGLKKPGYYERKYYLKKLDRFEYSRDDNETKEERERR